MNKEIFIKEINELGIDITEKQLNQLDKYYQFLKEYNNHTNLTTIIEENQVYLKHFYDSSTLYKAIDLNNYNNLLDIGSGAGFPGMIIKILFPNIKVTLLDSNIKKTNFLKELSTILELNNIDIIHTRAEDFTKNNREKFDIVTSRAVANLTTLSEISLPLTKIDGYFIPMKGSNTEEIEDAKYAIETLGGTIEKIYNFKLPIEESNRNIIKIKKIKETPKEYPRRYDKIIKSPLKKNNK